MKLYRYCLNCLCSLDITTASSVTTFFNRLSNMFLEYATKLLRCFYANVSSWLMVLPLSDAISCCRSRYRSSYLRCLSLSHPLCCCIFRLISFAVVLSCYLLSISWSFSLVLSLSLSLYLSLCLSLCLSLSLSFSPSLSPSLLFFCLQPPLNPSTPSCCSPLSLFSLSFSHLPICLFIMSPSHSLYLSF